MLPQTGTRPTDQAHRIIEDCGPGSRTYQRRRRANRVNRWHRRLRERSPLRSQVARDVWRTFVKTHGGDREAALGELVVALMEEDALPEVVWW